jgi:hypothetical protein
MTGTRASPAYALAGERAGHRQPSVELAALARELGGRGEVSVDDVVRHFGADASVGWLLLLLAVPALVPSPGVPLGMIFGTGLALLALHLTFGPRPVRLPKWIARRRLATSSLDAATARLGPMIERLERLTRPRLAALVRPSVIRLLGLVVLVNAVLIILPIPLGNTLPAMAVMTMALGLIARDGMAIVAGLGLSVGALAVSALLVGSAVWLAEIWIRE